MMMRIIWLCIFGLGMVYAQVEKVYDESGMLRAINPLDKKGVFEGTGYTFFPDGGTEQEIPYKNGEIHGIRKEVYPDGSLKGVASFEEGKQVGVYKVYYPDSSLKMRQEWKEGKRNGRMEVFFREGGMRIFALLRADSIVFAQNFDEEGKLTSARVGYILSELDTVQLPSPKVFFENGNSLRSNVSSRLQICQPKIPTKFITFVSENALIEKSQDELFPLIVTPQTAEKVLSIFLLIRSSDLAEPVVKRKILLPVK